MRLKTRDEVLHTNPVLTQASKTRPKSRGHDLRYLTIFDKDHDTVEEGQSQIASSSKSFKSKVSYSQAQAFATIAMYGQQQPSVTDEKSSLISRIRRWRPGFGDIISTTDEDEDGWKLRKQKSLEITLPEAQGSYTEPNELTGLSDIPRTSMSASRQDLGILPALFHTPAPSIDSSVELSSTERSFREMRLRIQQNFTRARHDTGMTLPSSAFAGNSNSNLISMSELS